MWKDGKSIPASICRSYFLLLLTALFLAGSAHSAPPTNPPSNSHSPEIEDSFAVSSLWGGDIWRVFVQGSDPAGDMKYIWAEITQVGSKNSSEIVPLKGDARRRFSGYLALYTPHYLRSWETVKVEIRIRDEAGNYSNVRTHEVTIGAPTKEGIPEKWAQAAQNRIGTIFFDFERPDDRDFVGPFRFHRGGQ